MKTRGFKNKDNQVAKEKDNVRKRMANVKLNSLLEVTKAINSNIPTDKLLNLFRGILLNDLNIGRFALFFAGNAKWSCQLTHGIDSDFSDLQIESDLLKYREITEVNLVNARGKSLASFDILIPVFHKHHPLAYLLVGDLDENSLEISPTIKHLPFLQTLTNIITVAIENKRLARENLLQVASNKEMELARDVQAMLFPAHLPSQGGITADAYYQPHLQVGGDYYDFIRLNENEVAFCMADVSGKGVSAALLMANFQANLRALFKHNSSLIEIVNELNALVNENAKGEKFITLFIAKYNLITRVMHYVNAGHNPPVLFHSGLSFPLTTGCIGIGMLEEIPLLREGIIHISLNSTLLCYTDGLTEQNNEAGEDFGLNRLMTELEKKGSVDMKKLNSSIINSLDKFRQSVPYVDDIALLSCRFN
jgi:sigma-B regulation protein RsbU (phosphoserine phosphatase)